MQILMGKDVIAFLTNNFLRGRQIVYRESTPPYQVAGIVRHIGAENDKIVLYAFWQRGHQFSVFSPSWMSIEYVRVIICEDESILISLIGPFRCSWQISQKITEPALLHPVG